MPIIEKMKQIWINDSYQKRISLDSNIIKQKALKILGTLKNMENFLIIKIDSENQSRFCDK